MTRRRWWKLSKAEISAARHRAWQTRRRKYGPRGHSGVYSRGPVNISFAIRAELRLARLVAYCLADGLMTEGQLCKVIEADRLAIREMRDDGLASLTYRPLTGVWGSAAMQRVSQF